MDSKSSFYARCSKIVERLKKHKYAEPFLFPVDPVALNIPDYPKIITEPMDISTVEKKIQDFQYNSFAEFEGDMRKIWRNALKYNPAHTQIHEMTLDIQKYFEKMNSEESEMDKFNKMKNRVLDNEKKIDRAQSKAGGGRHNKMGGYKIPNIDQPLTYQEKKNLSTMIRSLETEHLLGVWEIVSEGNDQIKDNEIEFDIETLPVRKARELEKYVQSKLELMKKTKKKVKAEPLPAPVQPALAPPVSGNGDAALQKPPLPANTTKPSLEASQPVTTNQGTSLFLPIFTKTFRRYYKRGYHLTCLYRQVQGSNSKAGPTKRTRTKSAWA